MIWTNQTQGNLFAEWNFGDGIWKMQANIIRVRVSGVTDSVSVALNVAGETIEYATDNTGALTIDLSDYFRTLNIGDSASVSVVYDENTINIAASVLGLVDPLGIVIPPTNTGLLSLLIAPPTIWFVPLFGLDDSVEVYRLESYPGFTYYNYKRGGGYSSPLQNGLQSLSFQTNDRQISFDETETGLTRNYERLPLVCGRKYAAVEWISRAGMIKRNTWEFVQVTEEVDGKTNYQTHLGYKQTKGQETSFVLRLSGLTRYDLWYYSDIILSNDVRVAVSEQDVDFGDETRVEVVTNNVEIPDANGTYKLEIEIKYKRYDEL